MTPLFGLLKSPRVAIAAFALALGACAGDDSGTSDTDTESGTGTTAGTTTGTTAGTSSSTASTTGTTDGTSSTTAETTGTTTSGGVTYEGDIQPIWDKNCVTGCHAANGSNPTLLLGADTSYAAIVGVMSVQATLKIVEPGDADQSYLWHKLNGSQADVGGSGLSMPFGTMLDGATLQTIETWINDGANP